LVIDTDRKQASLERQSVTLSEENATLKGGGVNVDNCIRDVVNVTKQEEAQAQPETSGGLATLIENLKGMGDQSGQTPSSGSSASGQE
jgi:hypothetical protein